MEQVSPDPYLAMKTAYIQNYDYGVAKVLKQKDPSLNESQDDRQVLGILNLENKNTKSETVHGDQKFVQPSQDNSHDLKTDILDVNKVTKD